MPTSYLMPSGAWLSGSLKPVSPPGGGNKPVSPPGGGNKPVSPPQGTAADDGADDKPTTPPAASNARGAALPWDGADPAWVYGSRAALLGQALRKSRAKLVRGADDQLTPDEISAAGATGRAPPGASPLASRNLWRWDPQFRIETVVAELSGRFMVRGRRLWMLDPGQNGSEDDLSSICVFPVFKIGPLPNSFDDQVDKVLRASVECEDRLPEILTQADDFWPFFESITNIRLASAPRFTELLSVAQDWGMRQLMGLKHGVAARRPMQWSSLVMPVITTPGHGSLPSGHATVSALNAELLRHLLYSGADTLSRQRAEKLDRLARRIAFNRVVAGVHFPVDSLVGYALGTQLARVLVALADPAVEGFPALVDDARMALLDPGTTGSALLDKPDRELPELGAIRLDDARVTPAATPAPAWAELWGRAAQELADLRV